MQRTHLFAGAAVALVALLVLTMLLSGRRSESPTVHAEGLQRALSQIEATCQAMGYLKT